MKLVILVCNQLHWIKAPNKYKATTIYHALCLILGIQGE